MNYPSVENSSSPPIPEKIREDKKPEWRESIDHSLKNSSSPPVLKKIGEDKKPERRESVNYHSINNGSSPPILEKIGEDRKPEWRESMDYQSIENSSSPPMLEEFRDDKKPEWRESMDYHSYYHPATSDLYLYRAYIDDRPSNATYIRVFGIEKTGSNSSWICQWAYRDQDRVIIREVAARKELVDTVWPARTPFYAIHIWCAAEDRFTRSMLPSGFIRLVSRDNSSIYTNVPVVKTILLNPKRDLAVCLKPVTGDLKPERIIEWVEMQSMVGVESIIVYQGEFTGITQFVWQHYLDKGIVSTVPFPFFYVLDHLLSNMYEYSYVDRYCLQQEMYLVAMHDCLYRYMHTYEMLLYIDIDEILLPMREQPIAEMLTWVKLAFPNYGAYMFNTAWHFEDYPVCNTSEVSLFLYTQRQCMATPPGERQPKSVMVTANTVLLNFHSVIRTLGSPRNKRLTWIEYGYVHHYSGLCMKKYRDRERCDGFMKIGIQDPIIPRYLHRAETSVRGVLEKFSLLP